MAAKKVLVVVSHGSKRKKSNQEFNAFIEKLRIINSKSGKDEEFDAISAVSDSSKLTDISGGYDEIRGACLEFFSPQLETVINDLVRDGYKKINIFPLFVFAGYHVCEDIPKRMKKLKAKTKELDYKILEHPAAADDFAYYIFKQSLNSI